MISIKELFDKLEKIVLKSKKKEFEKIRNNILYLINLIADQG